MPQRTSTQNSQLVPPLTAAMDCPPRRPQRKPTSHKNQTTKVVEVSKPRVDRGVKRRGNRKFVTWRQWRDRPFNQTEWTNKVSKLKLK